MIRRAAAWLGLGLAGCSAALAIWILNPPAKRFPNADTAIVLGAPLRDGRPGPVFQARIDHGIALLRSGRADSLILTGGRTKGAAIAEAQAARQLALKAGIPPSRILLDAGSQDTAGNLAAAGRLMRRNRLRTAMIVTDPMHMQRAIFLADRAGIAASPEPVAESRYRGPKALAHEIGAFAAMPFSKLTRMAARGTIS